MNITRTDYIELLAPLDVVVPLLHQPETWEMLPTGAERTGSLWRWGEELYTLHFEGDEQPAAKARNQMTNGAEPAATQFLKWEGIPLTVAGAYVRIELALYDALVSTLVLVRISLRLPAPTWPWQQVLATRKIAAIVRDCSTMLQTLLKDQTKQSAPSILPQDSTSHTAHKPSPVFSLDALRKHYPQTVAAFEAMGVVDHLKHVWNLSRRWERIMQGEYDPGVYDESGAASVCHTTDYDLIYAGGGMGLLNAAVMACLYGWRVLVFDDRVVGQVHREWNISRAELQALVDIGIVTWEELAPVIMREYRNGLVSFYTGPYGNIPHSEVWMPTVLNLAIDANALLHLMRQKLEDAGSTILDGRAFRRIRVYPSPSLRVEVDLAVVSSNDSPSVSASTPDPADPADPAATLPEETYSARLLLDGMGSTSPLTLLRYRGRPFDGFCPTVGTVVGGFQEGSGPREYDPTIGDILISVADAQSERQFIWEGFPGRNDETTVYVFYYIALEREQGKRADRKPYAHAPGGAAACQDHWSCYSLLELYEHYFTLLPSYKKPGPNFRQVRPVYGYIPGRHRLRSNGQPMLRGVLPVGDASALQSPLTYCGFGSHVRNLHRTTSLLDYALQHDALEPQHLRHINAFQLNVSLNWPFSYFMQVWGQPHNMNELQNVFLGALNVLGTSLATRFFQDRATWSDYSKIVWLVMLRYPIIMVKVWEVLKPLGFLRWERDYLFFTLAAAWAACGRMAGPKVEQALVQLCKRISPELVLRLRNQYAEWRAMGWIE